MALGGAAWLVGMAGIVAGCGLIGSHFGTVGTVAGLLVGLVATRYYALYQISASKRGGRYA